MFRRFVGLAAVLLLLGSMAFHPVSAAAATPAKRKAVTDRDVFALMASRKDIAFRYVADGCYARAHLMAQELQKLGIPTGKVWAIAQGDKFRSRTDLPKYLLVRAPHHPKGFATWSYHVAPFIEVTDARGKKRIKVIDPSLFSKPVSIQEWGRRQMPGSKPPYVTLTRLKEAPRLPNGRQALGTGYWLGADPPNPDIHALATMLKYKRKMAYSPGRSRA